jgi:hypothetical protein
MHGCMFVTPTRARQTHGGGRVSHHWQASLTASREHGQSIHLPYSAPFRSIALRNMLVGANTHAAVPSGRSTASSQQESTATLEVARAFDLHFESILR